MTYTTLLTLLNPTTTSLLQHMSNILFTHSFKFTNVLLYKLHLLILQTNIDQPHYYHLIDYPMIFVVLNKNKSSFFNLK